MSTVPAKQSPAVLPAESMEKRFQRLAAVWLAETAYISSSSDLVAHPAFQEIVARGPPSYRCSYENLKSAPAIGIGLCDGLQEPTQCLRRTVETLRKRPRPGCIGVRSTATNGRLKGSPYRIVAFLCQSSGSFGNTKASSAVSARFAWMVK